MDYTNSISYRRRRFKKAQRNQMKDRHDRLKNQADSLSVTQYQPNDKESVPGISNNFSSPVLTSNLTANTGLFDNDDEPTRIRALRIISQNRPLTQKEKSQVQLYYYMQDAKADKDSRYLLNEGYRAGKKLLGLNAQNAQIALN